MSIKEIFSEDDLKKLGILRDLLEDMIDTIDIITDEEVLSKINEALEEYKRGEIIKWEEVKEE